jgi:RimJ/RimL family protein N-acetyltransferase
MLNWPDQIPTFLDGDLVLRPWQESDISALTAICNDPAIVYWTTVPTPYTEADARQVVTSTWPEQWSQKSAVAFCGVLDGQVALSVALHSINAFDHFAEIGYWVAPEFRGSGLGTRAVNTITNWGFSCGLRRIHAVADVRNIGSQKTLLNAGYEHESIRRQSLTNRDDSQSDGIVFAKFPTPKIDGV